MPDLTPLDAALALVDASEHHVVLRRVAEAPFVLPHDATPTKRGVYLDTETTGTSRDDVIIELAMVPFDFDPVTGRIVAMHAAQSWLEDPQRPIPPEAARITGISDAMVAGHRIPDDAVQAVMEDVVLVVAHNAGFDRPIAEQRLPVFAQVAWACSQRDIAWKAFGYDGFGLDYLVMKHARAFHHGHRAAVDCFAGIALLSAPFADGTTPMAHLLTTARQPTLRLRAVNAPFDLKDTLRSRGYRWDSGESGKPKAWWIELPEPAAAEELAWLKSHAYGRGGQPMVERFTAWERYSRRSGGAPE